MSLTITTSATSTDYQLTSVQNFKDAIGLTASSDDGGVIPRLLNAVSAAVEAYLGYPILRQVYRETLPAYDTNYLLLSRTPLRNVFGLYDTTDTGTATAYQTSEYTIKSEDAGLIYRQQGFLWTVQRGGLFLDVLRPGTETFSWMVDYEAGYLPVAGATSTAGGTTTTGRTLPFDIEEATIDTARARYLRRTRDPGIEEKRVGDLAVSFTRNYGRGGLGLSEYGLTMDAQALLAPYRRYR